MFSIFDGHGGKSCCDFLKEFYHIKILENIKSIFEMDKLVGLFENIDSAYM